jgi:hypothetical protein
MQFESFSNFEVEQTIDKFFKSERLCQINFILLLNEVYKRRLYMEAGFSSTLQYCVQKFGMTEHSAYKRIQLAKVATKFPVVLEALKERKLSLTTASLIAPKLRENIYREQILQCLGKSKEEVKRIIVSWEPKSDVTESIRHYKVPAITENRAAQENTAQGEILNQFQSSCSSQHTEFTDSSSDTKHKTSEVVPLSSERTCLRFSIDMKIEEKLKRATEVCGVNGLEELLDLALEALLEKKDPRRREERREKKIASSSRKDHRTQKDELVKLSATKHPIPIRVKDRLLRQSGYQCTYVSPDGHRCAERRKLEVEHVRPRAKGGTNTPTNLTILCRAHNLYRGAQQFGWEKMRMTD